MDQALKQKLIDACADYVEGKLQTIQHAIDDLEAALKLETKCSMGDKYETGRAMLHLEFEKLAAHHEEFKKLRKTVRMIPTGKFDTSVSFGSAVLTSQANYFISIPAGEITIADEKFYAIGANAPLARIFSGKTSGDTVTFNGKEIHIQQVF
jgi:hypothetical protein